MSDALVPVITRVGLAAVVKAQADGLQATIDRIAVGRGRSVGGAFAGYTPSKDAVALASEAIRVPILSGSRLDPVGFRVLGQVPHSSAPEEYPIREVGFFLSTGQLFALWSSPSYPLAVKTALADIDLAFDLFLEQIPVAAMAITVTDPDIPDTVGVLAELLATHADTFIKQLQHEQRCVARGIY